MKMEEIRNIAQSAGMRAGKLTKIELIRELQRREGNFDCFATAYEGDCDQHACLWRADCFALARKGKRAA